MNPNLEKSITRSQELHVDRKMIGILSIFALLGICLVITIVLATNTLSALRAYASMQTHWTEARKESTFQLINYFETSDPRYLARFDSAVGFIENATIIRQELQNPELHSDQIHSLLLEIHTAPGDVKKMIRTYQWFHNFGDFERAISLWAQSDQLIYDMADLLAQRQDEIAAGTLGDEERNRLIEQVMTIDGELTENQFGIAASLAAGTKLLNTIIIWISSSLGLILLLIGGILSFRFLKNVQKWQLAIEMNEQKFRSLFEQNPNAIFSLAKDGEFVTGNRALEKMIGYPPEKLTRTNFDNLFSRSDREEMKQHFVKVSQGESQTFETTGTRKTGEKINMEITKVPIYVEGEIEGVFGIIHDITERKRAEYKIQEQLEEKTHLLAEVHDRVKNNLALMSGLIELEREFNDIKNPKYLENTISRIQSMAMVHERLYHTETFSSIQMDKYVEELSKSIKNKSHFKTDNYKLHLQTNPVALSIKQAIPAGLILNELLMNAFNYAFGDREEGNVYVELTQYGKNVILSVADDGTGLPDKIDLENPTTMGLKLVVLLSKQLDASLELENKKGTRFSIQFASKQGIYKSA